MLIFSGMEGKVVCSRTFITYAWLVFGYCGKKVLNVKTTAFGLACICLCVSADLFLCL